MRRTYEENPALGDPACVEPETERCTKRIDSLHQQVQRYQGLLNEIESSTPDAVKRNSGHTRGNSIISAEDTGSLSRSNSDESNIHNNSGTHHPTQQQQQQQQQLHHGHPHSTKGHRSKHITRSSGNISTTSSSSSHQQHLGGAPNGQLAGAANNGHVSNNALPRNRSSSSSSANSSNPATPQTPNTPHTPLSPVASPNKPPKSSSSHCRSTNTPASPSSARSETHSGTSTGSRNGPAQAEKAGSSGSTSDERPICDPANNGGGPLSPSNLTGGQNIAPIEEEGRPRNGARPRRCIAQPVKGALRAEASPRS
ncbi:formin-binding protein 1-like [Tropilaelaps mercedesae]|uniref:Formin-binding protein 1-like n=1 Tax=Tropilaelaps mercedesae TaxID=418985 RepID=A0A1V9X6P8_9ACAR|nr:formin-binding protein 1-like [Tropilaelaps mercedesae]